jgi:hypothetical protein
VSGFPRETLSDALGADAKLRAWRKGILWWKLDATQRDIYWEIRNSTAAQYVLEAARKLGKSYLMLTMALEDCLRHPGGRVNYGLPTAKEAIRVAEPILKEICADAPTDCAGKMFADEEWKVPNGAYIVMFGCKDDVQADRGRGPSAVASYVDEGAFYPSTVLPYALSSVLSPQHMRTGGKIVCGSSPPKTPGHSWVKIAEAAKRLNAYAHRDIYANSSMTQEQITAYLTSWAASKGLSLEEAMETAEFKREFLALTVVDETASVVPEFIKAEKDIVKEFELPPHFDGFASVDLGYARHATAITYGVADFKNQCLLVVDESWLLRANTRRMAEEMRVKEGHYWHDKRDPKRIRLDDGRWEFDVATTEPEMVLRVVDDPNGRLCDDLYDQHRISAGPSVKKDRDLAIALLRNVVQAHKVWIHPRCTRLIRQLRTATWAENRDVFEESGDDLHFDLVASLYMLVRAWWPCRMRNPYPADFGLLPNQRLRPKEPEANPFAEALLGNSLIGRKVLRGKR